MKQILGIFNAPAQHWVGDGFLVRSLFSYNSLAQQLSPFLLLDYAEPMVFSPTALKRGVGEHPHRGFETVTIVTAGEVEHRDSTGRGGIVGPGDVQWMTAGSGILHEEFHSSAYAVKGGPFEMVQLWINLPAKAKMTPPAYQALLASDIPEVDLPDMAGKLRVIAGDYEMHHGPAHTHSPLAVWEVMLHRGKSLTLPFPANYTVIIVVLRGEINLNETNVLRATQFALMDKSAGEADIQADGEVKLLILSGEPLNEPVVGYGPFVMNSEAEIDQAFRDLQSGAFGNLPSQKN